MVLIPLFFGGSATAEILSCQGTRTVLGPAGLRFRYMSPSLFYIRQGFTIPKSLPPF